MAKKAKTPLTAEQKRSRKILLGTAVATICLMAPILYLSPYSTALSEYRAEKKSAYAAEQSARAEVMENLNRFEAQATALAQEVPGDPSNKSVGLVAPKEAPSLPPLTPAQRKALSDEDIAAYEKAASDTYKLAPKLNIPAELLEPVTLSCRAADYLQVASAGPSMPADQYDPTSNAPLSAPAGAQQAEVFSEEVLQGGNSPQRAYEAGRQSAVAKADRVEDTMRKYDAGAKAAAPAASK